MNSICRDLPDRTGRTAGPPAGRNLHIVCIPRPRPRHERALRAIPRGDVPAAVHDQGMIYLGPARGHGGR